MRKIAVAIIASILAAGVPVAVSAAQTAAVSEAPAAKPGKKTETVTFSVGMHCANCAKKVKENISFEKGVKDLEVNAETKLVKVTFDPSKTSAYKLQKAIERLGYTATPVV